MDKLIKNMAVLSLSVALSSVAIAQETVLIGYAGPLTGSIAHLGLDAKNGVQLAIDQANSQNLEIGGKKVKFSLAAEDDAADPKQAVEVAQKLVDLKINGVVGDLTSGATLPASKVYSEAGIPQISPSATNPLLTRQGFATSFRVIGDDTYVAKALARYLENTLAVKRIAIVDDRTSYGQGVADALSSALKGSAVQVVEREYTSDKAIDFRAILTNIKAANVDAIFYGGTDAQAGPLRKQMASLDMRMPLLGSAIETDNFVQLAGPAAAVGTIAAVAGRPVETMPQGKAFSDAFKRYGEVVLFAPYAYDATWALIKAMENANSTNPVVYLAALKRLDFQGATGHIAFDNHGDLRTASVTLYKVDKGHFVPFQTVDTN